MVKLKRTTFLPIWIPIPHEQLHAKIFCLLLKTPPLQRKADSSPSKIYQNKLRCAIFQTGCVYICSTYKRKANGCTGLGWTSGFPISLSGKILLLEVKPGKKRSYCFTRCKFLYWIEKVLLWNIFKFYKRSSKPLFLPSWERPKPNKWITALCHVFCYKFIFDLSYFIGVLQHCCIYFGPSFIYAKYFFSSIAGISFFVYMAQ